jgi:hypothetical protein
MRRDSPTRVLRDDLAEVLSEMEGHSVRRETVAEVDRPLVPGFLFYYQGLFVGGPTRTAYVRLLRASMADWAGDRKDLLEGRA